ncbi:hypothetical protein BVX98_00655, partial [bacterium F11]
PGADVVIAFELIDDQPFEELSVWILPPANIAQGSYYEEITQGYLVVSYKPPERFEGQDQMAIMIADEGGKIGRVIVPIFVGDIDTLPFPPSLEIVDANLVFPYREDRVEQSYRLVTDNSSITGVHQPPEKMRRGEQTSNNENVYFYKPFKKQFGRDMFIAEALANDGQRTLAFVEVEIEGPPVRHQLRLDGENGLVLGLADGYGENIFEHLDWSFISEGEHSLYIESIDAFDLKGVTSARFYVDHTAPEVIITEGPANGDCVGGDISFIGQATDDNRMRDVKFSVNGANTETLEDFDGSNEEIYDFRVLDYPARSLSNNDRDTMRFDARDLANNVRTETRHLRVDDQPPEILDIFIGDVQLDMENLPTSTDPHILTEDVLIHVRGRDRGCAGMEPVQLTINEQYQYLEFLRSSQNHFYWNLQITEMAAIKYTLKIEVADVNGLATEEIVHLLVDQPIIVDPPDPPTLITNPHAEVPLTGIIPINVAIPNPENTTRIEIIIDGVIIHTSDDDETPLPTHSEYPLPWDTTPVANGTHTIQVIIYEGDSEPIDHIIEVTVDHSNDTTPEITITNLVGGEVVNDEIVPIIATTNKHDDIDHVDLIIDGEVVDTTEILPHLFQWNPTNERDGDHTIVLQGVDENDQVVTEDTVIITVDHTGPVIHGIEPIGEGNGNGPVSGSVPLRIDASDADSDISIVIIDITDPNGNPVIIPGSDHTAEITPVAGSTDPIVWV